jgi:hypothetical protein
MIQTTVAAVVVMAVVPPVDQMLTHPMTKNLKMVEIDQIPHYHRY